MSKLTAIDPPPSNTMMLNTAPTRPPLPARNADLILGIEHHEAGRLDEAGRIYQELYRSHPGDAEIIYLMGMLCCDVGAFDAACKLLQQALAVDPGFKEARAQLALALNGVADEKFAISEWGEAEQCLLQALEWAPDDARTRKGLGRAALSRGDAPGAEAHLQASLAAVRDDPDALNWLGLALFQQEKFAAAEEVLRRVLKLRPDLNQARNNLGLALNNQGRFAEAQLCFETTLAADPSYDNARLNLANTLRILGQPAAARHELDTLLAKRPDAADVLNNLGAVLQDQGLADLALASLLRATALEPASPRIRWNLALTQLQLGDFQSGWSNFESRWEGCASLRGGYGMPPDRAWRGEPLAGKRVLLWAEQGFGDTLQFARFAQDVAARGAVVDLMVQRELVELLQGVAGVNTVLAQGSMLPPYDFHCPLMSLPHRLSIPLDRSALHGGAAYLRAGNRKVAEWRGRLARHQKIKVGLVWSGSSRGQSAELAAIDARRSLPLQRLGPILAVAGCTFFSLQKGAATGERAAAGSPIEDFSHVWRDFSDTAAFIANLDLVISVDTAVAHLTGALGKPVWLLNRYDTCWRWLLGRNDSPWYSTLRQFRQPAAGDWQPAIGAAAVALARAVADPAAGFKAA